MSNLELSMLLTSFLSGVAFTVVIGRFMAITTVTTNSIEDVYHDKIRKDADTKSVDDNYGSMRNLRQESCCQEKVNDQQEESERKSGEEENDCLRTQNHIGELPSRQRTLRNRWPWDRPRSQRRRLIDMFRKSFTSSAAEKGIADDGTEAFVKNREVSFLESAGYSEDGKKISSSVMKYSSATSIASGQNHLLNKDTRVPLSASTSPSSSEVVSNTAPLSIKLNMRDALYSSSFEDSPDHAAGIGMDEGNDQQQLQYTSIKEQTPQHHNDEGHEKQLRKTKKTCIGSIFGLDVGGTLAKLVYFEPKDPSSPSHSNNRIFVGSSSRDVGYSCSIMGGNDRHGPQTTSFDGTDVPFNSDDEEHEGSEYSGHKMKTGNEYRGSKIFRSPPLRRGSSQKNHTLNQTASFSGMQKTRLISSQSFGYDKKDSLPIHQLARPSLRLSRSKSTIDFSAHHNRAEALNNFYKFAKNIDSYSDVGDASDSSNIHHAPTNDDKQLAFFSREFVGEFHFLSFETRHMDNAMDLMRCHNLHLNIREMGATGGGAHKYADTWEETLGIEMIKQEELLCLVVGMQFVLSDVIGECYTFKPCIGGMVDSSHPNRSRKTNSNNNDTVPEEASAASSDCNSVSDSGSIGSESSAFLDAPSTARRSKSMASKVDEWWWSRKVKRDMVVPDSSTYPYLLVTIGTGVSILRVDGPRQYERISGSSIGGGTYWGLCRLLTDVEKFEDVLDLASRGNPTKCDMMVGDIYGDNPEALSKLGLPSNIVASSFGKLVAKQDPASGLKQEDLARALLLMITNNIGQVAYLNAQLHNTSRIYFVGNFLRHNKMSQRRLSYSIHYWSKGEMEALFLEHEGYFGALGAFLLNKEKVEEESAAAHKRRKRRSNEFEDGLPVPHGNNRRRSNSL
mmetsp:Transcript_33269/g.38525  ORF Transcript_33269/g.38525 Transcript_33269/m.38525 type:complete len:902 (+) Transcript_33269:145-2850(+)